VPGGASDGIANATEIKTINNGFTEMLGGFHFLWYDSATPAFINAESSLSLSYITANECNYTTHVVETRDGISRALTRADLLRRWKGSAVPLYVGYRGQQEVAPTSHGSHSRPAILPVPSSCPGQPDDVRYRNE